MADRRQSNPTVQQIMERRRVSSMLMAHFWAGDIRTILRQIQSPPSQHTSVLFHWPVSGGKGRPNIAEQCDFNHQSAWTSGMKVLHDRRIQHLSSISKEKAASSIATGETSTLTKKNLRVFFTRSGDRFIQKQSSVTLTRIEHHHFNQI